MYLFKDNCMLATNCLYYINYTKSILATVEIFTLASRFYQLFITIMMNN